MKFRYVDTNPRVEELIVGDNVNNLTQDQVTKKLESYRESAYDIRGLRSMFGVLVDVNDKRIQPSQILQPRG